MIINYNSKASQSLLYQSNSFFWSKMHALRSGILAISMQIISFVLIWHISVTTSYNASRDASNSTSTFCLNIIHVYTAQWLANDFCFVAIVSFIIKVSYTNSKWNQLSIWRLLEFYIAVILSLTFLHLSH